jgi:hypothetical protein
LGLRREDGSFTALLVILGVGTSQAFHHSGAMRRTSRQQTVVSIWPSHPVARGKVSGQGAAAIDPSFSRMRLQALAIQGPGVIASVWPDWVILLYLIGVELTVE